MVPGDRVEELACDAQGGVPSLLELRPDGSVRYRELNLSYVGLTFVVRAGVAGVSGHADRMRKKQYEGGFSGVTLCDTFVVGGARVRTPRQLALQDDLSWIVMEARLDPGRHGPPTQRQGEDKGQHRGTVAALSNVLRMSCNARLVISALSYRTGRVLPAPCGG